MPIVEAMACGVPVVASSHPSLDEACGDAAVRVDPDDPEAIAAGDPRRARAARRARARRARARRAVHLAALRRDPPARLRGGCRREGRARRRPAAADPRRHRALGARPPARARGASRDVELAPLVLGRRRAADGRRAGRRSGTRRCCRAGAEARRRRAPLHDLPRPAAGARADDPDRARPRRAPAPGGVPALDAAVRRGLRSGRRSAPPTA